MKNGTAIEKVKTFAELKPNWNHNGAPAFPMETIRRTLGVIQHLPMDVSVFPTACQTIQVEWENSSGAYVEAEIHSDWAKGFFMKDGIEKEIPLPLEEKQIAEWICFHHCLLSASRG